MLIECQAQCVFLSSLYKILYIVLEVYMITSFPCLTYTLRCVLFGAEIVFT